MEYSKGEGMQKYENNNTAQKEKDQVYFNERRDGEKKRLEEILAREKKTQD